MTGWEPATEAEVAMRDALRAQDQQLYFRILTRVDLLLPVAAEMPGQAPSGWGTWTTGGRTHILAFTSVTALRACLGGNAGATRRVPYAELAAAWPNHEWWLAVNPGLPVEGYLPAWFVAQLSRGDVRLPGRTMGARARLERVETAARLRTGTPGRDGTSPLPDAFAGGAPAAPIPSGPGGRVPATGDESSTVPIPTPATRPRATGSTGPPAVHRPEPAIDPPAPDRPAPLNRRPRDDGPVRDAWPARPPRTASVGGAVGPPGDRPAPGSDNLSGWLRDLRRRPDESDPFAGAGRTGSANGPSGEPAPPPPARSFFEPSSSRRPPSPGPVHPVGERAVPPPRLGQGGQPFPRRRPLSEPVPEQPTRPFGVDGGEVTQALRPQEAARPFRPSPAPNEEATQALPRRHSVPGDGPGTAERTQPIPPGAFAPAETEELSSSIAEPVSGPPAPQRGFKPIVIEGTVIESRDLTGPEESPPSPPAFDAASEPHAVSTVPAATSAMATAAGSPHRTDGDGSGTPWAGPADPTLPLTIDRSAEPTVSLFEPPAPAAPAAAEPTVSLFEPPAAPPAPSAAPPAPSAAPPAPSAAPPAPSAAPPAPSAAPPAPEPAASSGPEPAPPEPVPPDFVPANDVEEELLGAAGSGSTDGFLSTLLLARVLLPVAAGSAPGSRPGDPGFVWQTEQLDGETYVVVYTSPERLADRVDGPVDTVHVKFVQLIRRWPDESWSFAVNPGAPIGAKYPGEQVLALANWAAEVGLGDDPEGEPEQPAAEAETIPAARPAAPPVDPNRPVTMQKALAPSQLAYYLERGYDRVSGFVHRAGEVAHLSTPAQLFDALGLGHPDSPFSRDAEEIYVLRWPAYRPSLYRIPYGGQNEAAMRAMEGWVIERPPFRGNGFAPGESSDVVAEFKVDSARLPHGAQLCRIGVDGIDRVVAILDTDALLWRRVGES
ncbi:SseB family protein [Micromonospora narathiwatensis]|uniref:SseB protein N-terminal domain-containing protein n=1 Tax=Micromonospora narathiwatensis TaxID=299146 RepID=A0A1A9ACS5_9ACTN|nr:SseB family protein [Micromonospora narathiwatensis]SBT54005.1 SseB protein N-terminal domain-containing protein [Micromonospora narathiwatensis]